MNILIRDLKKVKDNIDVKAFNKAHFEKFFSKKPDIQFHLGFRNLFSKELKYDTGIELLKSGYPIYTFLFKNFNTRKQKMSEVRTFLEKNQSKELYEKSKHSGIFNLSKDERDSITNKYNDYIMDMNSNKIQINADDVLEKMRKLILSTSIYDKAIALMLALGTRPIELFYKNKFSLVKEKPAWVRVDNIAKKRKTQEKNWTNRPVVMFTPQQIIKEVKMLRKHFKDKGVAISIIDNNTDQEKLNPTINITLNKHVINEFPFLKDRPNKSSFLRKIYADLAFQTFADRKTQNYNSFIAEILSHDSVITSFSYSFINLYTPRDETADQLQIQIAELRNQIQYLMIKEDEPEEQKPIQKEEKFDPERWAILENIYEKNPKISVRALKKESRLGSRIVEKFLKHKRKK